MRCIAGLVTFVNLKMLLSERYFYPEKRIEEIPILSYRDEVATTDYNTAIKSYREFEKEYLLRVLKFCKGRISGNEAQLLCLSFHSLP